MNKTFTFLLILFASVSASSWAQDKKVMKIWHANAAEERAVENVDSITFATAKASTAAPEAVDLGLSVKWASCNLGASKPEDFGNYYAWGETAPKDTYTEENYVAPPEGDLDDAHDAATVNLGKPWRMPTKDEMYELISKCTWVWVARIRPDGYGIMGQLITGPNGNSIFLPAAGEKYVEEEEDSKSVGEPYGPNTYEAGSYGNYWMKTYSREVFYLETRSDGNQHSIEENGAPEFGQTIRPVCP